MNILIIKHEILLIRLKFLLKINLNSAPLIRNRHIYEFNV